MNEKAAAVIVFIVFAVALLAAGYAMHLRDIAHAAQQQQPSEWVPAGGGNMLKTIIEADGVVCYGYRGHRSISCLRTEDSQ